MKLNWHFIREVGTVRWIWRTVLRQTSKRLLRRDNYITLPTGLRMTLPRSSKFASEVFITDCYVDWGSEALFARNLDAEGIFLDVGANIGYYSLYMLPLVSVVHSFEPDPKAYAVLQKNLAPHVSRSHAHPVAVGNVHGTANFAVQADSEVSHLLGSGSEVGFSVQQVPITTIDQFVADLPSGTLAPTITGIKIDVEGADFQVLQGARRTLQAHFPLVLTEASAVDSLYDFLQPLGYRVFAFTKLSSCQTFELHPITSREPLKNSPIHSYRGYCG